MDGATFKNWGIILDKNGRIIKETFSKKDKRIHHFATVQLQNKYPVQEYSILYPCGYIMSKEKEYLNLFKSGQNIKYEIKHSVKDLLTRFYLNGKEVYK